MSRSGYYAWVKSQDKHTERQKRRETLERHIHRAFLDSRGLYGIPKITKVLNRQGIHVSEKTVVRIMKELGLKSRTLKKYKATTNSNHQLPVQENVLNQLFTAKAPNQVWTADITYIPTDEGWPHLTSIIDLCTCKIVGFYMDERMTKELVIQALDQAYRLQRLPR